MLSLISKALVTRVGFLYAISIFVTLRVLGYIFEIWELLRLSDVVFTLLIINFIVRKLLFRLVLKD